MKLYDIKSRERRAISVQLDEDLGGYKSHSVTRVIARRDRETGENKKRPETKEYPPVLRWGAREVLRGLPESVMNNPAIKAHIKAGRLVVVATTEKVAAAPAKKAAPRAAQKRKRRS
jgi:hypothetical protein